MPGDLRDQTVIS